jgi:hypothetical protein
MGQPLILVVAPSFYEKQVVYTWLDVAFPVAREVFPVFGAYLGLISVKRALEMQKLRLKYAENDGDVQIVSVLIGRSVAKPHWTSRVNAAGQGPGLDTADAIVLQRTSAPVIDGTVMQSGELMMLDPRVVVRQHDTGAMLYQPRVRNRIPVGWMGGWMHRNHGWPDDWIQHGVWPENRWGPEMPPLVKGTGPADVTLFGDTMDRAGGLVQSARREIQGNILMEGQ